MIKLLFPTYECDQNSFFFFQTEDHIVVHLAQINTSQSCNHWVGNHVK